MLGRTTAISPYPSPPCRIRYSSLRRGRPTVAEAAITCMLGWVWVSAVSNISAGPGYLCLLESVEEYLPLIPSTLSTSSTTQYWMSSVSRVSSDDCFRASNSLKGVPTTIGAVMPFKPEYKGRGTESKYKTKSSRWDEMRWDEMRISTNRIFEWKYRFFKG